MPTLDQLKNEVKILRKKIREREEIQRLEGRLNELRPRSMPKKMEKAMPKKIQRSKVRRRESSEGLFGSI